MRRGRCVILLCMRKFKILVLTTAVFLISSPAHAQDGAATATSGSEISLFVGSLLPNQIEGVTEILPVFGGRYGFKTGSFGVVELGLSNSHAQGVDFSTFSGSLRADLPPIDQFTGFFYGGLDFNYYRPVNSDSRKSETGLHVGTGLTVHMSDSLWLRSDLNFMVQPGTSLSILFGLVYKTR